MARDRRLPRPTSRRPLLLRLSVEIELPPNVLAQKMRALAAEASQTSGPLGLLGTDLYTRSFAVERYRSP